MQKRIRTIWRYALCLLTLCVLSGCDFPLSGSGNSRYIYDEPPADDSIYAYLEQATLSGYTTYHYGPNGDLEEIDSYGPRDTDDGSWGWHERHVFSYDREGRLLSEQFFLPYVDNRAPYYEITYDYFSEGSSEIQTYKNGETIEYYYDTEGRPLLIKDSLPSSHTESQTYRYLENGFTEEYTEQTDHETYLSWSKRPLLGAEYDGIGPYAADPAAPGSSGTGPVFLETLYQNYGPPKIFWFNTYDEDGNRTGGDWCRAENLPAALDKDNYPIYCLPGYRVHWENGLITEIMQQEWDRNSDAELTSYTLYDYDQDGNPVLTFTFRHFYQVDVCTLSRFEYDENGRKEKEYLYNVELEDIDCSLPLFDGSCLCISCDSETEMLFKKLSAAREVQSLLYFTNGRFQMQYIGKEPIVWQP